MFSSFKGKDYDPKAESFFDVSTYWGRVAHFMAQTSPNNAPKGISFIQTQQLRNILISFNMCGMGLQRIIFHIGHSGSIIMSNIHQGFKKPINKLFRFSSFVYTNMPIVFGLACVAPTTQNIIFFQSLNQSYNFGMNYTNRNASNTMDFKQLGASYAIAVGTSVSLPLTLKYMIKRANLPKNIKVALSGIFLQFIGVATAGFVNLMCARNNDIRSGIYAWEDPSDPSTRIPRKSIILGRRSFLQCGVSRIILPIPVFFIPHFGKKLLMHLKKWPKKRTGKTAVDLSNFEYFSMVAVALAVALPMSIAIFPQWNLIPANKLEKEFQNRIGKDGKVITHYIYNKGA